MAITRLAGGRIAEQWDQADMLGLLRQLGVFPAPDSTPRSLTYPHRSDDNDKHHDDLSSGAESLCGLLANQLSSCQMGRLQRDRLGGLIPEYSQVT